MQFVRWNRQRDSARWLILLMVLGIFWYPLRAATVDKVVTDADKGGQIDLKPGESFELKLKSNPSTGYMWYVEPKSTQLVKLVHQSQTGLTDPTVEYEEGVCQPDFQIFKFEARHYGKGVLLLHYVRSWMPATPQDEQFDLHVVVE